MLEFQTQSSAGLRRHQRRQTSSRGVARPYIESMYFRCGDTISGEASRTISAYRKIKKVLLGSKHNRRISDAHTQSVARPQTQSAETERVKKCRDALDYSGEFRRQAQLGARPHPESSETEQLKDWRGPPNTICGAPKPRHNPRRCPKHKTRTSEARTHSAVRPQPQSPQTDNV